MVAVVNAVFAARSSAVFSAILTLLLFTATTTAECAARAASTLAFHAAAWDVLATRADDRIPGEAPEACSVLRSARVSTHQGRYSTRFGAWKLMDRLGTSPLVEELVNAAMSILHHDAGDEDVETRHERR